MASIHTMLMPFFFDNIGKILSCVRINLMAKRGRKPKNKNYFAEEQEKAVADYIRSTDVEEKNRIFNEILRPAFTIMIESIIRRYSLYPPDEEFKETFDDTISFLMTKIMSFKPETKFKAYSYCGTICKNYLIYKINQYNKRVQRYDSVDSPNCSLHNKLRDNIDYSYIDSNPKQELLQELTGGTVADIERAIKNKDELMLSDNDVKVGNALISLLKGWEELFSQMGSNKFNKSSAIMYLKETTMLSSKEIRASLKKFKSRYYDVKANIIN